MDIHILPANIANMIAAGEVVQRPASVVKELMENAVDAGASKVNVIIRDAGRTLVQVIDNGCGMTPDQAVLCFQRHATSKISSAEDLQSILTYGFRGEALASIAAVARVTLKTRTSDMEVGTMVTITDATADDPGRQDIREVAAPVGSNFSVADLYYNTPARRKFLKSDASELRHITDEFIRVALSNPETSFSLTANDREVYRLGPASSLLFRIRDLFGQGIADEMLPLDAQTTIAGLSGFVVRPQSARKTVSNQYLFVNGRYFRSPYLHKAVLKAYENLIPDGAVPSYFLYLTIDPHTVDINVHPTKTEIKFEDDNVLFTIVMAAVKDALGRESFGQRLDFERGGLPEIHNIGSSFEEFRPVTDPGFGSDPLFNPFDGDGFPNQGGWDSPSRPQPQSWDKPRQDYSALFQQEETAPETAAEDNHSPLMLSGRFIIRQTHSGFILVDMLRALQRIMYERFIEALSKEKPVSQSTLFPIEVELGASNLPLLQENSAILSNLGFDFAPFSATSILVSAVPEGMSDDKMTVTAFIFEMITALSQEQSSIAGSMFSPLAEKLSASAARSVTLPSTEEMARTLLEALYNCDNPEFTPDGRRTVAVLGSSELEKLLK